MKTKLLLFNVALLFSVAGYSNPNIENVQAMYIYNFLHHIKWPENTVQNEFVIGVYGDSDIYQHLLTYTNNRSIGTKKIKVVRISTLESARNCQLLFVARSKSSKISEIARHPNLQNTLIVSEVPGVVNSGAAIEFAVIDNKLKFKINESNANKHHIAISKTLLDMSI